jgi:hypothetical protein
MTKSSVKSVETGFKFNYVKNQIVTGFQSTFHVCDETCTDRFFKPRTTRKMPLLYCKHFLFWSSRCCRAKLHLHGYGAVRVVTRLMALRSNTGTWSVSLFSGCVNHKTGVCLAKSSVPGSLQGREHEGNGGWE